MKINWMFALVKEKMTEHVTTLVQYPPRQKANSIDISKAIEQIINTRPGNN